MKTQKKTPPVCCPPFDPELWDQKIFEWDNKKFIRASVKSFFYIPLNFGSVITGLDKKIKEAEAEIPGWLCLSDHTSKWNMNIYLAVDKEIPGVENVALSGRFFCRVYEGSFKDTAKWCDEYKTDAKQRGFSIKKWFMWYTTCPKCARKYGKNYVAIFTQVE